MANKRIVLYDLPDEIALIVEHPTGVTYQNQVGGSVCWQAELEGVLSPLDVDPEVKKRLQDCPYPDGRQGITPQLTDTVDALLASVPATSFLEVDRAHLDESWEAWVHVLITSPEDDPGKLFEPYQGPLHGFGRCRGVLTWPNSD